MIGIAALVVGIVLGLVFHPSVPEAIQPYLPIAVVAARLSLDVQRDLDDHVYTDDALKSGRQAAFDAMAAQVFEVRLGEITRTDDGLLGYFVDDDYRTATLAEIDAFGADHDAMRARLSRLRVMLVRDRGRGDNADSDTSDAGPSGTGDAGRASHSA